MGFWAKFREAFALRDMGDVGTGAATGAVIGSGFQQSATGLGLGASMSAAGQDRKAGIPYSLDEVNRLRIRSGRLPLLRAQAIDAVIQFGVDGNVPLVDYLVTYETCTPPLKGKRKWL